MLMYSEFILTCHVRLIVRMIDSSLQLVKKKQPNITFGQTKSEHIKSGQKATETNNIKLSYTVDSVTRNNN